MGLTVKNVCKLINELRPDVDITVAGEFGEGVNERAWFYSTIYDSKPPNFENLVTKDKEVTAVEIATGPELNDESVTVRFDMNKKEEKMEQSQNKEEKTDQSQKKEPLKLLTMLAYIKGDEYDDMWLEARLETRTKSGSRYLFVEGFAEALKSQSDMLKDYYVERILYADGNDYENEEERHLLIHAVKEE